MAKHFTSEEIENLKLNPYVKKVSISTITYTHEFREWFIAEYAKGKIPSQIVQEAGFDTHVLGSERIHNISKRFRKMAIRPEGFTDTRKVNSGRPATREISVEEQVERLKNKVKYLEQENEFLKKIEFLDRQAEWKKKRRKYQKKSSDSSKK